MKHFRTLRSYKKILQKDNNISVQPTASCKTKSKTLLQCWNGVLRLGFLVCADRRDSFKSQSLSEEKGK